MLAPLIGNVQKLQLITESNKLLDDAAATASMTLTAQPVEPAHLRASISSGSGTITFSGTDENDAAITETLTFSAARDYITGYLFKSVTGLTTALTAGAKITVTAENDSGEPVNATTYGSYINGTFYELNTGNRIYQTLGIVDKVLYYVKLPKKWEALIDNTVKFKVIGRGDAVYQAATAIGRVYTPGTNIYAEIQFYATEIRKDD